MPEHALHLLKLHPALKVPATRWGVIQVSVTTLGRLQDDAVLYLEPFPQRSRLFNTELWQQMPFVRMQRFTAMRSTWTHGGVFCIEQLAIAITDALLTLPGSTSKPDKRGDEPSTARWLPQ